MILGHDDRALVRVDNDSAIELPERSGFAGDAVSVTLHPGWNKLSVTLYNSENVNWRWCGLSLAFERDQSKGLRFAAQKQ
jgi:hypothetical protein